MQITILSDLRKDNLTFIVRRSSPKNFNVVFVTAHAMENCILKLSIFNLNIVYCCQLEF